MKVLLTGEPHSGKTTLLKKFLETVPEKQGFITEEVTEKGQRTGFRLISSVDQTATLASVESDSAVRVSRYGVEVEEFEKFLSELPPIAAKKLIYVDEIGRMELYSEKFKRLVSQYLDSDNPYIGTIASNYNDDFTEAVKKRPDVKLIEVTEQNRDELAKELSRQVFGI